MRSIERDYLGQIAMRMQKMVRDGREHHEDSETFPVAGP